MRSSGHWPDPLAATFDLARPDDERRVHSPESLDLGQAENGGTFASINRPIAGATHDKVLPVGKHPLQLYSLATPNGVKVTVMLEELLALGHNGAEYDAWLIKIGDGDQFGSGFVEVNPNSKIPALMDRSGPTADPGVRIRRDPAVSGGEVRRLSADRAAARAECLSWLFWQMGSAPYLGGGFGHFYAYAPIKIEYAINRFAMETKRQLDVLDRRLAESEYHRRRRLHHCRYGDLALVWAAGEGPALWRGGIPATCRTTRMCSAGPTRSPRGLRCSADAWSTVSSANPQSQLHERHDASDFDTKTQDKVAEKA